MLCNICILLLYQKVEESFSAHHTASTAIPDQSDQPQLPSPPLSQTAPVMSEDVTAYARTTDRAVDYFHGKFYLTDLKIRSSFDIARAQSN